MNQNRLNRWNGTHTHTHTRAHTHALGIFSIGNNFVNVIYSPEIFIKLQKSSWKFFNGVHVSTAQKFQLSPKWPFQELMLNIFSTKSSDVVEARRGNTHLGTYFLLLSHRLDASRHFLAYFLVISDHVWHLNFTDCFGGKRFSFGYQ